MMHTFLSSCCACRLTLNQNNFGDPGCIALAQALPATPLSQLDLRRNRTTVEGGKVLWASILKSKALQVVSKIPVMKLRRGKDTRLTLASSQLGDCEIGIISEMLALPELSQLQELHLGGNPDITVTGINALVKVLLISKIVTLKLHSCDLQDDSLKILAPVVSKGPLKTLSLGQNKGITAVGMLALADALKDSKLESLFVYECNLDDKAIQALAPGLLNHSLKSLSLDNNKNISANGFEVLGKALANPGCKVESLNAWRCSLDDAAMSKLSAYLPSMTSLKELNLRVNKFGDDGCLALAEAVPKTSIQEIHLGGKDQKFTTHGIEALALAFASPSCKVQTVSFYEGVLDDTMVQTVITHLPAMKSLQKLHISENNLSETTKSLLRSTWTSKIQRKPGNLSMQSSSANVFGDHVQL